MKRMKKIVGVLLTMIMVLSMSMAAFAEDVTYSITINNEKTGHTYEAYQIFTGRLDGDVLSDIVWGDGVNSDALLAELKDETAFASCETAASVAKVLEEYTTDSADVDAFAAIVAKHLTGTKTESAEGGSTYTISGLKAGYYFVKDAAKVEGHDAHTKFMLKVVKNVAVEPKSDVPSVTKKVQENEKWSEDDGYNDVADWNIGDNVPFRLTGTLPDETRFADYTTYKYIFHDTLSEGLTYNNDAKVYVVNGAERTELTTGFTVTPPGTELTIAFDDVKQLGVKASSQIVVEYTAKLNEKANIGIPGNENSVYLEFSNNPNAGGSGDTGKTPEDKVIVFTYELDVTKVDGQDEAKKLKDAEFKLRNEANQWVKVDAAGKVVEWVDAEADGSVLKSGEDGLFKVIGLDDGIYYLKETKAPAGYNILEGEIKIEIIANTGNGNNWDEDPASALTVLQIKVADGTAVNGNINNGTVSTQIKNNQGSTLPETGGIGTTIFYILGGILAVGAAILLIVKRRMGSER